MEGCGSMSSCIQIFKINWWIRQWVFWVGVQRSSLHTHSIIHGISISMYRIFHTYMSCHTYGWVACPIHACIHRATRMDATQERVVPDMICVRVYSHEISHWFGVPSTAQKPSPFFCVFCRPVPCNIVYIWSRSCFRNIVKGWCRLSEFSRGVHWK